MTFIEYPKCLYKLPGPHVSNGLTYDCVMAKDAESEARYRAEGWTTLQEALDAQSHSRDEDGDNAPPTREELEAKATELGIKFDGRTGDKTLLSKIEDALKG